MKISTEKWVDPAPPRTNRSILTNLLESMDEIELAIVRERLMTISKEVIDNSKEVKDDMTSGFFGERFAEMYIKTMQKVWKKVK
jgi:hypothetical protein